MRNTQLVRAFRRFVLPIPRALDATSQVAHQEAELCGVLKQVLSSLKIDAGDGRGLFSTLR